MFKALIGLSINLLQVIYAHASLALSRLKNKQAILKIKPHTFELHPDLTKDYDYDYDYDYYHSNEWFKSLHKHITQYT